MPIATPVVKWATEVTRLEDLPRIVHRAAKIATTPPTGPVFISLPGDILNAFGVIHLGQARMPFNVTGQPVLVIPARFSTAGLPLSLQFVGRPFTEPMLYRVAQFYEDATGWTKRHPAGLAD